jgi:hypothetical protein
LLLPLDQLLLECEPPQLELSLLKPPLPELFHELRLLLFELPDPLLVQPLLVHDDLLCEATPVLEFEFLLHPEL